MRDRLRRLRRTLPPVNSREGRQTIEKTRAIIFHASPSVSMGGSVTLHARLVVVITASADP